MVLDAASFLGQVTFITGPEKGSGKTTLLNYCLGLLRTAGERAAFVSIGFDGERRDGSRAPRIACRQGEVFVTAADYLESCGCAPEVLNVLPGSSALGRLAIARARRDGEVVLVGSERNAYSAWAIDIIRRQGWARTVLVDGAINRLTQVASFPGARFVFAVRADPGDLERSAAAVRRMTALARLPAVGTATGVDLDASIRAVGLPAPALPIDGPLTATSLARMPGATGTIVVDDFTKVFLDPVDLASRRGDRALAVRTGIAFGGFVVTLRDVSRRRFLAALADPAAAAMVAFNPYEVAAVAEAAGDGA
jgi:hypothetical protein